MGKIIVWSTTSPPPEPPQPGPPIWVALDRTGGGAVDGYAADPVDGNKVWAISDNSGVYLTEDGGDTWANMSYNLGACRLNGICIDPNDSDVIYVAAGTDWGSWTSGGDTGELHRTLDGGAHWEFVATGMGFQSSLPTAQSIAIPSGYDADADSIGDVIVLACWNGPGAGVGGIWRSTDEGASFAQIAVTPAATENMTAVYCHGADNDIMYACSWGGSVYKSIDAGATWSDVSNAIEGQNFSDMAVHPTDPAIVYITAYNLNAGDRVVQKTINSGTNWSNVSTGLDPDAIDDFPKILMDKDASSTLYLTTGSGPAGTAQPYTTADSGANWTMMDIRLVLPDDRPYFWYEIEGKKALVETASGILMCEEKGPVRYPADSAPVAEWQPAMIGFGNVHTNGLVIDPQDATRIWMGIEDFGPYRSDDSGTLFYRILGNGWPVTTVNYVWNGPYYSNYVRGDASHLSAGSCSGFAVSFTNSAKVYSSLRGSSGGWAEGGINLSTDAGASWSPVGWPGANGFDLAGTGVPFGMERVAVSPANDAIVYALQYTAADSCKLWKSSNSGSTWAQVASGNAPHDLAVSEADSTVLVVVTHSNVQLSINSGASFASISPASSRFRTVALSPHDSDDIVIGTDTDGWWHSDDQGANWTHYEYDDIWTMVTELEEDRTAWNPAWVAVHNVSTVVWDPTDAGTYYLGGEQRGRGGRSGVGIIKCTGYGAVWERLTLTGLQHRDANIIRLNAAGTMLYAGGFDGVYSLDIS